jgi:CheY-like chemotaxis protein
MAAVLLVEDVSIVRMVLRGFLESGGHGVTECHGGEEASRLMNDNRYEVVVTDICMTDGDGLAFIRNQRLNGSTIPIIAITAGAPSWPRSKAVSLAIRAGANSVLMKPVTKSEILEAIEGSRAHRRPSGG